ncbi:MAG TPA: STAS domain-containing protein [Bryobacteraceae bacterium]|nr:STAS domain-containing protein [Bryobacteraceae bacterium]
MEELHVGVTKSRLPGTAILRLVGPLTLATQFELENILRQIPDADIILDVYESPYIDSAGLGTILAHWSHTRNRGGRFAMTGVTKRIQMLLELTRVNTVLPVFRTPDEAELAFAGQR